MTFVEPALVLVYGASKLGKTTDALFSFPNALFLAAPGALKPSVHVVGFDVPKNSVRDPTTISDAAKIIAGLKPGAFDAVVVDDFSLLADQTVTAVSRLKTGWAIWDVIRDDTIALRTAARRAGMHIVLNAHEKAPETEKGLRGGPRLPGKMPEQFPAACDLVLRAEEKPRGMPGMVSLGWHNVYRCDSATGWISGDRHGVTPAIAPMNLRVLLTKAGYRLSRLAACAWQENTVAALIPIIAATKSTAEAQAIFNDAFRQGTAAGYSPVHLSWAFRDVWDSVVLQRNIIPSLFTSAVI